MSNFCLVRKKLKCLFLYIVSSYAFYWEDSSSVWKKRLGMIYSTMSSLISSFFVCKSHNIYLSTCSKCLGVEIVASLMQKVISTFLGTSNTNNQGGPYGWALVHLAKISNLKCIPGPVQLVGNDSHVEFTWYCLHLSLRACHVLFSILRLWQ